MWPSHSSVCEEQGWTGWAVGYVGDLLQFSLNLSWPFNHGTSIGLYHSGLHPDFSCVCACTVPEWAGLLRNMKLN